MDKRSVFAFILIAVVWIIWLEYFVPKKPKRPLSKPQASQQQAEMGEVDKQQPPEAVEAGVVQSKEIAAQAIGDKSKAEEFNYEDQSLSATISSWGAGFISFKLKNYRVALKKESEQVNLLAQVSRLGHFPQWSFIVNGQKFSDQGLYQVVKADGPEFIFERQLVKGLKLRKSYHFDDQSYLVQAKLELLATDSGRSYKVGSKVLLPIIYKPAKRGFLSGGNVSTRAVTLMNDKIVRFQFDDKDDQKPVAASNLAFAGVDDLYFLKAYLPQVSLPQEVQIDPLGVSEKDKQFQLTLKFLEKSVAPGENGEYSFGLFLGPKDIHQLRKAGHDLEQAIDLGSWLGPIARPLLSLMKWLFRYTKNYGLVIILITLLVRLLMNPLNRIQYKQMKKMQALQPEIAILKEKFKDDKVKQQQETMALFRRHKVNPMGGCLPLLVQMPIFIALYRVLYNSIELRHAPFFLWINDLSAKDPYFITPLLMGLTMYLQQKMTPTTGDQTQQAMMKIMPIGMTFLFLWLPSGLVLYILTSTVLGLVQQRKIMAPSAKSK